MGTSHGHTGWVVGGKKDRGKLSEYLNSVASERLLDLQYVPLGVGRGWGAVLVTSGMHRDPGPLHLSMCGGM